LFPLKNDNKSVNYNPFNNYYLLEDEPIVTPITA